jgi:hypothetical protein
LPLKKAVRDLVKHHGYQLRSDVQLIQFSSECGMPDYSFDPGTGKSYTRHPLPTLPPSAFPRFKRCFTPAVVGHLSSPTDFFVALRNDLMYMRVNSGIVNTPPL